MFIEGLLFESTDGLSRFLVQSGQRVVLGRRPPLEPQNVKVPWRFVSREHVRIVGGPASIFVEPAVGSSDAYLDDLRVGEITAIEPGSRLELGAGAVYSTRAFRGKSLTDVLRSGPLDPLVSLTMARSILLELAPLHAAGEAHGALAPYEILCGADGSFPLLAQGHSVLDAQGAINCNPLYLAPETLLHRRVEPATDLYVLGSIVFEALSGRRPFEIDTPAQHVMAKLSGAPPRWEEGWPPSLTGWLGHLMTLLPEERLPVDEALARLDELCRRDLFF